MRVYKIIFLLLYFLIVGKVEAKTEVYFSPDDKINKKLIQKIGEAKKKIYAAVYMLTDKTIAQALIAAKVERGIDVQIITDKISAESSYGKAFMLAKNGVPVFVFVPSESSFNHYLNAHAIMHHKFALFDNTIWTGSFNWTRSASSKNRENVITVSRNIPIHNTYLAEFNLLKQASVPCTEKVCTKLLLKKSQKLLKKLVEKMRQTRHIVKKIESGIS